MCGQAGKLKGYLHGLDEIKAMPSLRNIDFRVQVLGNLLLPATEHPSCRPSPIIQLSCLAPFQSLNLSLRMTHASPGLSALFFVIYSHQVGGLVRKTVSAFTKPGLVVLCKSPLPPPLLPAPIS